MLKKIFVVLIILNGLSFSQGKLFQPHDVFKLKSVDEAVISPDENYVAFSLKVPRPIFDGSGSTYEELYLYNFEDKSVFPLITGKVSVNNVGWTNDSKSVSFTAKFNKDKTSQIYTISLDGTDTLRLTNTETSILKYQWHPNQNKLAYITVEKKIELNHSKLGFDLEVFEENIPARNLYLLDSAKGITRRLNKEGAVFNFQFSPTGEKIAAAIAPNNLVDDSYMFTRLHIIDVESGDINLLVENPGKLGGFSWSPDEKNLAFISGANKNDAVVGSLFVVPVPFGKRFDDLKNYSDKFIGSVTNVKWKNSKTLLFVSEEGVYTTLREQKIDSDNSHLLFDNATAVFSSISVSQNKIAFSGDTPKHPKELLVFDLTTKQIQRITFHNEWLNEIILAKQDVIKFKASDGLEIEGLLFYPINFKEGDRYPLIVYAHGGPESTNSYGWNTSYNRWGQSAAAKNFFVFMPNYRSGSGRGNKFTMMGFADAGGREFNDVLDGIDYLVKKGYVDRERVGIGGGSYGGYFSAWAASKHTKHFAAAVSFVGVGNQLVKRNTTDIPWESYLVHWGYWVNEDPMAVYDKSPVRYAEQMNTPLLLLHGTKDPRVHPSQSLEMYRAFSLRGSAPVRLVWYNGEGHGNSKNTNRLDYHLRTLEWFEYYLKSDNPKNEMPSNEVNYNLEYFN